MRRIVPAQLRQTRQRLIVTAVAVGGFLCSLVFYVLAQRWERELGIPDGQSYRPLLALLLGLLLTVGWTVVALLLQRSREVIEQTVERKTAALRASEERFVRVIEATTDGIWEQDIISGRMLYVSPNTETMLGYPVGSFTRPEFSVRKVFPHEDDRQASHLALEDHITNGKPYACEVRMRHADGHERWMRVRGVVSRDEAGNPLRIVGSLRDVTAEREERLRLDRFRDYLVRLLDNLPDAIAVKDAELRFVTVNRAFAMLAGVPVDRILGARTRDFFPPEVSEPIEAMDRQVLETGLPLMRETRVLNAARHEQRIHLLDKVFGAGPDGEPLVIGVHHDITERKALEEDLRAHRDHLEELVTEQTLDLVRAKEAAEQANQAKSDFLANMSHELRTPMHAVLSFARIGYFKAATAPPEKLKGYFENIRASGERLLDLVNDLLDLSKLEAGRMEYHMQRMDLQRRAHEVVAELAPLFEAKKLSCDIVVSAGDCHAQGDPKRIDQILRNLLGNAIKFTPEGRRIEIAIAECTMPAGRRASDNGRLLPGLLLTVADEGVGIPEAELESVFDKFTQSSRTNTGAGGTGLGLAICSELTRAHRGIIRARNRPAGGAAIDVLLPVCQESQP